MTYSLCSMPDPMAIKQGRQSCGRGVPCGQFLKMDLGGFQQFLLG
jgi:hypothetical protein